MTSPSSDHAQSGQPFASIFDELPGVGRHQVPGPAVDLLNRFRNDSAAVTISFEEWGKEPEVEQVVVEVVDRSDELRVAAELAEQAERQRAIERQIAAAREEGFRQAQREYEGELVSKLAEERRRLDRLRLEFARDRQRFFAAAEAQVVKLALAIAGRVLSREVQSEGLHLRSTVKAALARVQENSATRLMVPEDEAAAWSAMFERDSAGKVIVVADARLKRGDCLLETNVGRVELGVEAQLEEIERSFAQMLQVDEEPKAEPVATEEAGGF